MRSRSCSNSINAYPRGFPFLSFTMIICSEGGEPARMIEKMVRNWKGGQRQREE